MDEPLGALDKQLREHMQYEIKHLHEQLGVTVVYVTHDQSEALTMSDRIAVFNDGRIQQLARARGPLRAAGERLRRAVHRREQPAARHGRGDRRRRRHGPARGRRHLPGARGQLRRARRAHPALDPARAGRGRRRGRRENRTEAEVLELIYHGDHIRCRLRGARQRRLHRQGAEQPRPAPTLQVGGRARRSAGGPRTAGRSTPPDRPPPARGPAPNRRRPIDLQGDPNDPQTASRRHRRRDPADRDRRRRTCRPARTAPTR